MTKRNTKKTPSTSNKSNTDKSVATAIKSRVHTATSGKGTHQDPNRSIGYNPTNVLGGKAAKPVIVIDPNNDKYDVWGMQAKSNKAIFAALASRPDGVTTGDLARSVQKYGTGKTGKGYDQHNTYRDLMDNKGRQIVMTPAPKGKGNAHLKHYKLVPMADQKTAKKTA